MPWKDGYTISDERGISDADVRWPGAAVASFTVTVDLGPDCGPSGITAADLSTPEHHYAMHGGLDALRRTFEKHGIRATFATSGVIAELYPEVLRSLVADGHEVAANGYRREDVGTLGPDEERDRVRRTADAITAATSVRPEGWYTLPRAGDTYAVGSISPHTVDILLAEGLGYLGNSPADDVPHYWVTEPDPLRAILAMPYYYAFDDQFYLLFPSRGTGLEHMDSLARNWRGELDAQYRRGRSVGIVLHPHAIAWPHRLQRLDDFLSGAGRLPGLWNATAGEVARWWRETHPLADLRIEPSTWQHHDDSLN